MVIIGTPSKPQDYFMADGDLAFRIHQAGFPPRYSDDGVLYFRLNAKLRKWLEDNGIAG
nr:MAG TPA: Putative stress-responsive nuclear envelope protein [Caudoviricetes sp.]